MEEIYIKDFDSWHDRSKILDSIQFDDFFYPREIWWCALGVNIGSEQDGKNEYFERPILIIKKINKDLLWILPITSKVIKNNFRVDTTISGTKSQFILSQIRAISSKRLIRKVSTLNSKTFNEILIRISLIILNVIDDETPLSH